MHYASSKNFTAKVCLGMQCVNFLSDMLSLLLLGAEQQGRITAGC